MDELTTLERKNHEATARVVSLKVSSLYGNEELTIPQVFARPNLHLSPSNLVTEAEVQKWPHLKDHLLHHAEMDDVTLLIGQDCPEALIPLITIPGGKGEPYAIMTCLGWSVSGPVSNSMVKVPPASHYISNGDMLHEKVERFWKIESSGIYEQEKGMSVEDRRVLELWDKNVSFSDGHYTLPIPFKNPALKLPDNRQMAERRLSSLKHKLLKNHDLHRKYMDGMNGDKPMFLHPQVPTPLYSYTPMFRHPFMFLHPYTPTNPCEPCSYTLMFLHPYVPTPLCSDTPICNQLFVQFWAITSKIFIETDRGRLMIN